MSARQTPESFWARVERSRDGCWEWQGSRTQNGYGRVKGIGTDKLVVTHRTAWELTYGPIPNGMEVCHSCDNPPCCNPAHLFLGSHRANMVDAARKGRMGTANRKRTHCKLGHPLDYVAPTGKRGCLTCRRRQSAETRERLRQAA